MFGGSTDQAPPADANVLGQEPDQSTTNEGAQPVRWFCGTRRVGAVWLDGLFKIVPTAVYQSTKKDDVLAGYNYSTGCAFLLGVGQFNFIHRIIFDRVQVWPLDADNSPVNAAGTPYKAPMELTTDVTHIEIVGYGTLHLHRGSETQVQSADLNTDSGHEHPAYRGMCWGWFDALALGYQKTNLPNIEVIASRFPKPSWFTLTTARVGEFNVNPMAALADFLQNKRVGPGWNDARLDTTALNAVAAECAQKCIGLSPFLDSLDSASTVLARFAEHLGGFFRIKPDGTVTAGLIRPSATIPDVVDEDALTMRPRLEPAFEDSTSNQVSVRFTNADNYFRTDQQTWLDAASFDATQEIKPQTLERPWWTSPVMAYQGARAEGLIRSQPQTSGRLSLRLGSLGTIVAGGFMRLSFGHLGLCGLPLRVERITYPAADAVTVEVTFHVDPSISIKVPVAAPTFIPPTFALITVSPIIDSRFFAAYPGMTTIREKPVFLVLPSRATASTGALKLHRRLPSGSYQEDVTGASFATHGALDTALPITGVLTGTTTFDIQLEGIDTTLDNIAFEDAQIDRLLLFVGDEVVSVYEATLIGAGQYRCKGIRGRYGSPIQAHAAGDEVFLTTKANLFAAMPTDGTDATFKLQPLALGKALDLASADPETATGSQRSLAPLAPIALRVGNDGVSPLISGDALIEWSAVPDSKPTGFWSVVTENLPGAVLEFYSSDGLYRVRTEEIAAGLQSFTYTTAMQGADGPLNPTIVRAYQIRNGLRSEHYDELTLNF